MPQDSRFKSDRAEHLDHEFIILTTLLTVIAVGAFWFTKDRVNWLLDAGWVVVGIPLILWSRRSFRLTPLLYRLLVIHALVLIAGGYWTYEKMPLGVWLQDVFAAERNHFDRFGHFLQGFVPAILFREIFLRCTPLKAGGWLSYFVLSSCLSFSAFFELLEWWATLLSGDNADSFLGHQGDVWDAQWDMLWALVGATLALALLTGVHDRALCRLVDDHMSRSQPGASLSSQPGEPSPTNRDV